jgi:hypothetical protein
MSNRATERLGSISAVLGVTALLFVVSASGPVAAATLAVGAASGGCGTSVSVPVTVSGASGLLAVQFRVTYDASRLTPGNPAAATGSMTQGFSISSNASGSSLVVALAGGSPASGTSGTVAVLTFDISSNAPSGTAALTISEALVNDQPAQVQSGGVSVSCGSPVGCPSTGTAWILPSSARVSGAGGVFWKTDLTLRNGSGGSATVCVRFLGHSGDGRGGPERSFSLGAGETRSYGDVLSSLFSLPDGEYGPLLVRSETAEVVALGQTWTAGGGGTYGQSVPAMGSSELVGSVAKAIVGIRQGSAFRTNLVLANPNEQTVEAFVQVLGTTGGVLGSRSVTLGPLGFQQIANVAAELGAGSLDDGTILVSSRTAGAFVATYGVVIDQATGDPRTLLAR